MIVETPVDNDKPNSSHQDEDKAADDMLQIRMLSIEDFKKYGHSKSRRYYLHEQLSLNHNDRKSGLITNHAGMTSVYRVT